MIHGSCLCGQVRFELDGAGFRWTAGERCVQNYEASPGNFRAFCKVCGSNLPVLEDEERHVTIPAGALDDDPVVLPVVHIHTASKAPWYAIADGLPQFTGFPPDEFWSGYE